jgi:hypothetical protein
MNTTPTPEEQELIRKQAELESLEAVLVHEELEFATLTGEVAAFNVRYLHRVGRRYAELDGIERDIAEARAKLDPNDAKAVSAASEARKRARASAETVNEVAHQPEEFKPTEALRQTYRQAARRFHPDRALNEEDLAWRNQIMAEINVAYQRNDIAALDRILREADGRPEEVQGEDVGAKLIRAIRRMAQIQVRLSAIDAEIEAVRASNIYQLKIQVETEEQAGGDPLGDLVRQVEQQIEAATRTLNAMKGTAINLTGTDEPLGTDDVPPAASEPPSGQPAPGNSFRPEGCIHRTDRGEWVRSKSEVVIANLLHQLGLDYRYEHPLEGTIAPGIRRPDFVFFDPDGKPLLWEHLGMLDDDNYREKWKKKRTWYEQNDFTQGINLFITRDEADGSLDSQKIRKIATYIKTLI